MSFFEAEENCRNFSAKLFDYFDGNADVIELMLEHMQPVETFWTGVRYASHPDGSWITGDKQRMNTFLTIPDVDSIDGDDKFLAISFDFEPDEPIPLEVFVRKTENDALPSVCYRIENIAFF